MSSRRVALKIAVSFATLGIVWMIITDVVLYAATDDPVFAARTETVLDWVFIVVASAMIYVFAHRAAAWLGRTRSTLSAVVESIGDGLLVLGPDRRIVHANPAALQILACDNVSELVGMTAQEFSRRFFVTYPNGALIPPDAFYSQRAFDEPGPFHYKVILHPPPDHEIVVRSTAAAVRGRSGDKPALVVAVMHDVTDTEYLERLRDRFFAAAAHALKTPVAIIKANVQFLLRTTSGASRASFLAVQRQCDRIDVLVQNLQIVARARSHSLVVHLQEMELAPLVAQVARELVSRNPALDLRTEIRAAPRVYGDHERLALAIRNLGFDALKLATSHSPLTLELLVRGAQAELSARYHPLPIPERTFATYESYDDTKLSRCATDTIAEAHGGDSGEDFLGDGQAALWIRLPTMEEP